MINTQKFRPTKVSQARCILLLAIVFIVYLTDNIDTLYFNKDDIYIYTVKPIIWGIIPIIAYFFPRLRSEGKIRLNNSLKWWVGYLAFAYVILMFMGGLIYGFGKSPYDLSPTGIGKNMLIAFLPIVSREIVRAYLINSIKNIRRKKIIITLVIFAVLYTVLEIPLSRFRNLQNLKETIEYAGDTILPELSKNIIAGYLVYLGGAPLSVIYLLFIQAFNWMSPILPNLNWMAKAVIGTLCPIFSLMIIEHLYSSQLKIKKKTSEDKENPIGWIATMSFSLAIIWFAAGVFPVYPSVIVTGSMMPMIKPGDVVLLKKMDGKGAKLGDVIQFKSDNIFIVHRIINVKEEGGQLKFQTKGDNNSVADSGLVDPGLVKGKLIKVIPKIGWPSLLLKDRNQVPKERVEF